MLEVFTLIAGILLLFYSSPKVVDSSSKLAHVLKVSPLVIGVVIVGMGTSIPEISNSIISSLLGHGNINVGNAIGSSLSQITLIFGICVFAGGEIKVKRSIVTIIGGCLVLSSILAVMVIEKGVITRMDGLFLIVAYFALVFVIRGYTKKEFKREEFEPGIKDHITKAKAGIYFSRAVFHLVAVMVASYIVVNSIILMSKSFGISEFVLSYAFISIGTSLPELAVGLAAVKEKKHDLLIGDILGSNLTDVTLSLGAGPLFLPNIFDGAVAMISGWYLVFATIVVIALFVMREKLDRKSGLVLILMYCLSYLVFSPVVQAKLL